MATKTNDPALLLDHATGIKPKEEQVNVRMNATQRAKWRQAAADLPLSDWVRQVCDAAADGRQPAPSIHAGMLERLSDMLLRIGKRQLRHEKIMVDQMDLLHEHVRPHATPLERAAARKEAKRNTQTRLAKLGMTVDEEGKVDPIEQVLKGQEEIKAMLAARYTAPAAKRPWYTRIIKRRQ